MATPPAAEKKDQRAPGTSGTVGTTGTAYTMALNGFESQDESRGTASPALTPREAVPSPPVRTSPNDLSAMDVDKISEAAPAISRAPESPAKSVTEKTGDNETNNVKCYNHLMPYTKIIREGDFAIQFLGKIFVLGETSVLNRMDILVSACLLSILCFPHARDAQKWTH